MLNTIINAQHACRHALAREFYIEFMEKHAVQHVMNLYDSLIIFICCMKLSDQLLQTPCLLTRYQDACYCMQSTLEYRLIRRETERVL